MLSFAKNIAMKASSSVRVLTRLLKVFLIVNPWSCTLIDPPLQFGSPRTGERPSGHSGHSGHSKGPDTLLLVSAVEFPVSYDWQRDTAYGGVSCTVRLFRGREVAVSIPAGRGTTVSAAPDGHRIIEGDLYTLYSDSRGTFIGRNGGEVASWDDREYILGLFPRGKSVYTLGRRHGGGLSFRLDGKELYGDALGTLFGSFSSDTYGPTGALYECGGSIFFAYGRPGEVCFVRDGELLQTVRVPSGRVLDAKYIAGGPAVLYNRSGATYIMTKDSSFVVSPHTRVCWTAAGLVEYGGGLCAAGSCGIWSEHDVCWGIGGADSFYRIAGSPEHLYFSGGNCLPLELASEGVGDCRFFSRSCADALDGEMALALTPKDPATHPYVLFKGTRTEFPVYGFLSGVSFQIAE